MSDSKRTEQILHGPLLPVILQMAAPTIAVMLLQGLVNAAEVYFMGRLGAAALAGATLCFPAQMMMGAMSGAGMGGGISSAVARAVGAGRKHEVHALTIHALAIALGCGVLFTALMLWASRSLYSAMGGKGEALEAAVLYSDTFFYGATLLWLYNTLASLFRGIGNMQLPAKVGALGGLFIVAVSPALIFGWGPLPALGIRGAAFAGILYFVVGGAYLWQRVMEPGSLLRPIWSGFRFRKELFAQILRVGLPSSLNSIVGTAGALLITGLVGQFGTKPIAGYGLGARLEFVLIPIIFGLGTAIITVVGTNIGAGNPARAARATWAGAALGAAFVGALGIFFAVYPELWLQRFTQDPEILATGRRYFHFSGPCYFILGGGVVLYFAAQGFGKAMFPLLITTVRLLLWSLGGAWAARHWGLDGVFSAVVGGYILYAAAMTPYVYFTLRRMQREKRAAA